MSLPEYEYAEDMFRDRGTGSHEELENYELIEREVANYTIKIRVTADGRFVDIVEVRLSKDFADYRQKAASLGSWDASEYYTKDQS